MGNKTTINIVLYIAVFALFSACAYNDGEVLSKDHTIEANGDLQINREDFKQILNEYLEIIYSKKDENRVVQLFIEGNKDSSYYFLGITRQFSDYKIRRPGRLLYFDNYEPIFIYSPFDNIIKTDSALEFKINRIANKILLDEADVNEYEIHDYPTWKIAIDIATNKIILNKDALHPFAPKLNDTTKFIPPKLDPDEY